MTSSPHGIVPVPRATLASTVARELRELMTRGAFAPGDQLNEVELASRFGISRGPVREGLRMLVSEGLLRSEPHRGVFVPVLDAADVNDIYLAREAIELAAFNAILLRPDRLRLAAKLQATIDAMRAAAAAGMWAEVVDLDLRFHSELVDGAESARLSRMYGLLIDETRVCLTRTIDTPARELLPKQHERVIESLSSGDERGGAEALSQHFSESIPVVRTGSEG